jgi:hypothetical protein
VKEAVKERKSRPGKDLEFDIIQTVTTEIPRILVVEEAREI